MVYQFRLANWNEEGSPTHDARTLRYLLLSNSSSSSSVAFNNRTGSAGSNDQLVPENIMQNNHHLHSTININNNSNDNLISPSSNSSPPRLFGSSLTLVPTARTSTVNTPRRQSSMFQSRMGQVGAVASNHRHIQSRTLLDNNNNNGNGHASIKRSRSPDFVRGESSNQGSQAGGIPRRRTYPPTSAFQQDSVNVSHNNLSSTSTPYNYHGNALYSSLLQQHVNQSSVNVAHNSITSEAHIINQRPTHAASASFFDDTPRYNSPSQSILDEEVARYLFSYRQDTPQASFTITRRIEPAPATTTTPATSLYPAASTSPFQRNNNFLSSGAGSSSSSSRSRGWGFNGLNNHSNNSNNNNTNANFDLFDTSQQRIDDSFVRSTINIQQHVRILPNGSVNRFFAPTLVPARSNSSVPRQSQLPFDPSTSSYRLNPHPPPPEYLFGNNAVESDRYFQTGTTLARSRRNGRRRANNQILTSTAPELRAARNRLRDQVFNTLQHLRTGGSVRTEDLMILDYSIVLNVLDSQEHIDILHNIDDWPYEVILALEEHIGRVETGLTEEEILTYIETEIHVPNPQVTSTQNETCTICQEDYVEGEVIGRLDCTHIYHLECIKQWLLLKNVCPICKQTALEIDEDEDESD